MNVFGLEGWGPDINTDLSFASRAGASHVEPMKPLPDVFALHGTGDLWFVIAPTDHEFRARTFERMEAQAVKPVPEPPRPRPIQRSIPRLLT
jgi:hypothetical protein